MHYILFCTMIISLGGLIISTYMGTVLCRRIFKVLTSLLFIGTAMVSSKRNLDHKVYRYWIIGGLVLSTFGDVFLAFSGRNYFLLGVACFIVAHICYIIAFSCLRGINKEDFLCFGILLIPLIMILLIGKFEFKGMLPLVMGYMFIIGFMVVKAISLKRYYEDSKVAVTLSIVGALLFLISDGILLFKIFGVEGLRYGDFFNSLTYYVGQELLAISLAWPIAIREER